MTGAGWPGRTRFGRPSARYTGRRDVSDVRVSGSARVADILRRRGWDGLRSEMSTTRALPGRRLLWEFDAVELDTRGPRRRRIGLKREAARALVVPIGTCGAKRLSRRPPASWQPLDFVVTGPTDTDLALKSSLVNRTV